MRLQPTSYPQLVLLRHGQTQWSATGRHTGRTDVALLPQGQQQAQAAGAALADFEFGAVYASPLQRARHTARLAGYPDPVIDENLMEWDYGPLEGRTAAEISAVLGREFQIFDDGVFVLGTDVRVFDDGSGLGGGHGHGGAVGEVEPAMSAGEKLSEVAQRAARFIETAEETLQTGQDVLAVAHGHFLRVLATVWLGLDPGWAARFELDTAAICLLGYGHHLRTVEGWNLPPSA